MGETNQNVTFRFPSEVLFKARQIGSAFDSSLVRSRTDEVIAAIEVAFCLMFTPESMNPFYRAAQRLHRTALPCVIDVVPGPPQREQGLTDASTSTPNQPLLPFRFSRLDRSLAALGSAAQGITPFRISFAYFSRRVP